MNNMNIPEKEQKIAAKRRKRIEQFVGRLKRITNKWK